MHRDIEPIGGGSPHPSARAGRSVVAVIGIDQYREWPRLGNAVRDALGAARLFTRLGFVEVTKPLLDGEATAEAMRRLVTESLSRLAPEDSLVVFFAGHGHTHTADFGNASVKTGYVIPVDATEPRGSVTANWLRLDSWLSDIARLPARHILVLIDACYSGVALSMEHKWRDAAERPADDPAALAARRSRRVITSALDDQRAMDGGPYPGHSLFTGCLIEGLSGGLTEPGRHFVTGREIGLYLHRRVRTYPPSTQTPDVGVFELDDRGDIIVPLVEVEQPAMESTQAPRKADEQRLPEPAAASPSTSPPDGRKSTGLRRRESQASSSSPAVGSHQRVPPRETSLWQRPVKIAHIANALIAGALAWMLVFNMLVVYEYQSDGPSLYRPYGRNGSIYPAEIYPTAIEAALFGAFFVMLGVGYLFVKRSGLSRQEDGPRKSRGIAGRAKRVALIGASFACGLTFTAFSIVNREPAGWIGTALATSILAALLVGLLAFRGLRWLSSMLNED